MSVDERVRRHFDVDAPRFDAIYESDKGVVARFIDDVWRGVVRRRFALTLDRLAPLTGRHVLDVGCGSGRYCVAYALAGAARVVGIDFSEPMVRLAEQHARRAGVATRCSFHVGTFPEDAPDGPFDASSAMGYFDYVADPRPSLARMREVTRSTVIASFPKAREWRVPLRRLRFRLAGCPLFLYSASDVRRVCDDAGVRAVDVLELDRDYVVIAQP